MQNLNVLFLSSWYPNKEYPTLGNFIQKHAESVNPYVNLYVLFATSSDRINGKPEIENNIINGVNTTIVYFKKTKDTTIISKISKYKNYIIALENGLAFIEKKFKVNHLDITHCNITFPAGLFALKLKKERNIPYVISENWTAFLPYRDDFQKMNFIIKREIKKVVANAASMVPVSEHLKKSMIDLGLNGKFTIIPNVVDTSLFKIASNNKTKIQLLHVSTLVEDHKNIKGTFNVLKKISESRKDFLFTIVSDGDPTTAKEHQKEIGLDTDLVNYVGTKTPEEIAEYYQQSDFFVLFSNYENLPCVMVESMSAGIPVVASDVGGVREHLTKENGIIVEAMNEDQLYDAISDMLNNYKNYNKNMIRQYAIDHFNYDVVGQQFLALYKEIIK